MCGGSSTEPLSTENFPNAVDKSWITCVNRWLVRIILGRLIFRHFMTTRLIFRAFILGEKDTISAMTRAELIANLAIRFPTLVAKDADIAVKVILDAVGNALAQGDRVEIRGFGSFELNYRPPRTGRNPKSGEALLVPAKYVPHFKVGKEMRECVEQSVKP